MVTLIYDNGDIQGTREAKPKLWKRALRAFTNPRRGEDTLMVIVVFLFAILFTNPGRGETTFDGDGCVDIEMPALLLEVGEFEQSKNTFMSRC